MDIVIDPEGPWMEAEMNDKEGDEVCEYKEKEKKEGRRKKKERAKNKMSQAANVCHRSSTDAPLLGLPFRFSGEQILG